MDLSSSPSFTVITKIPIKGAEKTSIKCDTSTLRNSDISAINSTLYDSAIEDDQTTFVSFNGEPVLLEYCIFYHFLPAFYF